MFVGYGAGATGTSGVLRTVASPFVGKSGMWLFSNRGAYAIVDFDDADEKNNFHWYFLIRSTDGSEEFKLGQHAYRESNKSLAWQAEEQM